MVKRRWGLRLRDYGSSSSFGAFGFLNDAVRGLYSPRWTLTPQRGPAMTTNALSIQKKPSTGFHVCSREGEMPGVCICPR